MSPITPQIIHVASINAYDFVCLQEPVQTSPGPFHAWVLRAIHDVAHTWCCCFHPTYTRQIIVLYVTRYLPL